MSIRVMLVEDHAALRAGLELLLEREGMDVVGSAGNVAEGFALAARAVPDVAVIDVSLGPDDSGIDLVRRLLTERPEFPVVLYTGSSELHLLHAGLDSGARGYALKDGAPEELIGAIRDVSQGGTYVDPRLRPALLSRESTEKVPSLSKREREVIDLLAQGLNGEQIAERLFLSSETVKTHVRNAMTKLRAATRVHAVAIALREGLISQTPAGRT